MSDSETGAICLAVYRPDVDLLERQLRSIIEQTLTGWRCHIGIDGTDAVAEAAVRRITAGDDRFVVHAFADNVGHYRNFERLLAGVEADAGWVALADQDDRWYPDKLEHLVAALTQSELAGVCCQSRLVSPDGTELGVTDREQSGDLFGLLLDNRVTGTMSLFTAETVRRALPFPAPTDSGFHDHWLGVVAQATTGFGYVETVMQDYVQHPGNSVGELNTGIGDQLRRLRARAGGLRNWPRYVAVHRWGWRAAMAQMLLERNLSEERAMLTQVAAGRPVPVLYRRMRRAFNRADVPGRRLAVLAFAMLFWPSAR